MNLSEVECQSFLCNFNNLFVNNLFINIILSIFIGVILGCILYRGYICPPIIRGPNSRDIIDKIFAFNGKYYELEPKVCGCLKKSI